jgi:hypothetical protein
LKEQILEADEVVLFERATFLVISHCTQVSHRVRLSVAFLLHKCAVVLALSD